MTQSPAEALLKQATMTAIDLLAERTYCSPARSSGHNARLVLEKAMAAYEQSFKTIKRSGVYVASRASIPERGKMWRDLRSSGVKINATWIDEDGPAETANFLELWPRIQREIDASELLIAYFEPEDFPVRGVLIEIGMALSYGIPVIIVAPSVKLEGRSMRPLGSWLHHPLVSLADKIEKALATLEANSQAGEG